MMDTERLTESALQMVASAQQIAQTRKNQNITPAHLAAALLADPNGPASRVVERAGGNLTQIQAALAATLDKLPKVSGASGQYMSPEMARV
ncbi:MAG TPA: Clp protease N-terminal domain-containing protein, partial [Trueperaceae bacterium]